MNTFILHTCPKLECFTNRQSAVSMVKLSSSYIVVWCIVHFFMGSNAAYLKHQILPCHSDENLILPMLQLV